MNKFTILIPNLFLCDYVLAADTTPNDFDLACDSVQVTGYSLGKDRIPMSYITWDKRKKSLTIKSEELSEFNGDLNQSYYEIYSSQEDFGESKRSLITFKEKSYAEKWAQENRASFVSVKIDYSPKSKGAVFLMTEFWQTGGVISSLTTKQAICKMR
jgi:hypothetical protein